jgi:hypothetical protein
MEFWSAGVLRILGIAPRVRGVGVAFRAICRVFYPGLHRNPGLFYQTISWSRHHAFHLSLITGY